MTLKRDASAGVMPISVNAALWPSCREDSWWLNRRVVSHLASGFAGPKTDVLRQQARHRAAHCRMLMRRPNLSKPTERSPLAHMHRGRLRDNSANVNRAPNTCLAWKPIHGDHGEASSAISITNPTPKDGQNAIRPPRPNPKVAAANGKNKICANPTPQATMPTYPRISTIEIL